MKKTLAAVAVLTAFAGSAFAAEVTVYGRIDAGFAFENYEATNQKGEQVADENDLSMDSGLMSTNRLGFKGSETISEDLEVGFVLETKVVGDTGAAFANGFDRESLVYAKTNYGTIYAGKVGTMWSDGGSTNFFASNYIAGGSGGGRYTLPGYTLMAAAGGRYGNRISYVSPTFAGFTLYGEYSFGIQEAGENTAKADRPAAIGLKYANGPFGAGMVVSYTNEASNDSNARNNDREDELTVNLGAHYDAGIADFKLAGQYFKGSNAVGNVTGLLEDSDALAGFKYENADGEKVTKDFFDMYDDLKGYGIVAGADIPAWGGEWTISVAYTDAESEDSTTSYTFADDAGKVSHNMPKVDLKGYSAGVMYAYPLSKQTVIKAGVGYIKVEAESAAWTHTAEYENFNAVVGLLKYF